MSGLITWFARNHVAANLLMFALIVIGLASFPRIEQKSFPDFEIKIIQITIPYLGAAPEEVESGVCIRIEEAIQGINGIELIRSLAAEGACTVSAELIEGYSEERAQSEIKNAIDAIENLPLETETPIVAQFEIRRMAIQIALSGDTDERSLKIIGQRVRDELAAIDGITQVQLSGARNYEVSIEVQEATLNRYQLSFDEVVRAVRRSSIDLPGGALKTRRGEILLRSKGQAYTGRDFEKIVVRTDQDGTRLLLGDIATVVDGFEEDLRYARFDGKLAVMIQVYRIGDQRILDLAEKVRDYAETTSAWLPEGIELTVWQDGSTSLRDRLDILTRNGLQGFVLVFLLLAFFLRLRLAFWVSIGVPLSFLGALALFPLSGVSINVISLFAFIMVLGLLVDDAIVVGESVHSHQERAEDPLEAAILGTREVSIPVIFGVLTTVAAFLPLITADGMMGNVFSEIGLVVVFCLIFSVIESQLILPAHLTHARTQVDPAEQGPLQQRFKRIQDFMSGSLTRLAQNGYRPWLDRAIEWRYTTLAIGVMLLLWTQAILMGGVLTTTFMPVVEANYVTASLEMPLGVPVESTAEAIAQLEASAELLRAELAQEFSDSPEPVIKHILASVGAHPSAESRHGGGTGRPTSGASHIGEVSIELQSSETRPIAASEIERRWRNSTPGIPDAVELTFSASLFDAGDPLAIRLQSADVDDLRLAANELKHELEQYPGVFEIRDSFRDGKREIKLSILPSAELLGLSLQDLGRQVRQAFYGAEIQRIQRGRDELRVMVRYPESERRSLADLEGMRIRTPGGDEVPFDRVASAEHGIGYASIWRLNRMRVVNVNADVDRSIANSNQIMADLRSGFMKQLLADHPGLQYELQGEQHEQSTLYAGLARDFSLALVLIYALLAIPLRSYTQPLIIMAVIPFGLVGAIGGHVLMGQGLSLMSAFGVVALAGVVVNASLVLVYYINTRRELGVPLEEAVKDAGVARFRPIVLTSLTTFVGLTPLLLERSVSAQFLIPMAISLAFGVAFATVVTLFAVPSAYIVLEDLKSMLRRMLGRDEPTDSGGDRADVRSIGSSRAAG